MKCRGAPVCAPKHTGKQPGRHTGLPLRQGNKTKEHKDKQNVGAQRCVRPKIHKQSNNRADTPVCPYGKAIRQKNKKTNNVGAQRCVRPKTQQSKETKLPPPAGTPSAPARHRQQIVIPNAQEEFKYCNNALYAQKTR